MNAHKYIKAVVAMAAAAATLTACDENAWNDHLKGFEEQIDAPMTNVQRIDYTLTDADYAAIAANSTNKALAGEDLADALAAVGTKLYFTPEISAAAYVPAFMASSSFPYFTLTDGSAVMVTYRTQQNAPAILAEAEAAQRYTVPKSEYTDNVWGSDEDYIEGFAPSEPASEYLPAILNDNVDGSKGKYVVVQYKEAATDPVFGSLGDQPAKPSEVYGMTFTESLGDWKVENVVLPAVFETIWKYGGEAFGAKANAFDNESQKSLASDSWLISPAIDLAGYTGLKMNFDHVYNKFPDVEFAKANCTLNIREDGATDWTKIDIPTCTHNTSWDFVNSGEIDLAAYEGKKIQIAFHYVSEDDKSGTWEVKNLVILGHKAEAASAPRRAPAFDVTLTTRNAMYVFEDGEWTEAKNFLVLDPDVYTAMGQSHANLSTNEPYISIYLNRNYPYAAENDYKYVMWLCYANSKTSYRCSEYNFNGTEWVYNDYIVEETGQFVNMEGTWKYDPSVTLVLPAGKNQPLSSKYFQACVDWVYENICVPLGDTSIKSGKFYVSSYGNNEYYSGTSAYQGNLDLRPDKAREQYKAGYEGMSDDEIIALEKKRFLEEVMPGALAKLHPDAKPIEDIEVLYTITFGVYDGSSTKDYTAVWEVTGPTEFTVRSCTWDKPAEEK